MKQCPRKKRKEQNQEPGTWIWKISWIYNGKRTRKILLDLLLTNVSESCKVCCFFNTPRKGACLVLGVWFLSFFIPCKTVRTRSQWIQTSPKRLWPKWFFKFHLKELTLSKSDSYVTAWAEREKKKKKKKSARKSLSLKKKLWAKNNSDRKEHLRKKEN